MRLVDNLDGIRQKVIAASLQLIKRQTRFGPHPNSFSHDGEAEDANAAA